MGTGSGELVHVSIMVLIRKFPVEDEQHRTNPYSEVLRTWRYDPGSNENRAQAFEMRAIGGPTAVPGTCAYQFLVFDRPLPATHNKQPYTMRPVLRASLIPVCFDNFEEF